MLKAGIIHVIYRTHYERREHTNLSMLSGICVSYRDNDNIVLSEILPIHVSAMQLPAQMGSRIKYTAVLLIRLPYPIIMHSYVSRCEEVGMLVN